MALRHATEIDNGVMQRVQRWNARNAGSGWVLEVEYIPIIALGE
jgi:hypothetical protein